MNFQIAISFELDTDKKISQTIFSNLRNFNDVGICHQLDAFYLLFFKYHEFQYVIYLIIYEKNKGLIYFLRTVI